jgi:hypothetical protein
MDASARQLGDWVLIERIGKGGMGEVWRAERVGAGNVRRRAAVKRILDQFQSDPVLRERFIAEARTNARLEHPNIAQVIDFGDAPELYLVLEYIDGAPASALLRAGAISSEVFPVVAAIYIVAEAATGLDYAHRRTDDAGRPLAIVHRDVSPSNILVSFDGAVKVNDFGIARAADNLLRTQAGLALGKLVYMAPEQAAGRSLDHRADLFALGVVLWEFLALRPLLPRHDTATALAMLDACNFAAPSSVRAGVPPALDDLLRALLARDPAHRPASGAHVSRALRTMLATAAPGFGGRDLAHVVARCLPEAAASRAAELSLTAAFTLGAMPAPPVYAPAPAHASPMPAAMYGSAAPAATFVPPAAPSRSSALRNPALWIALGIALLAAPFYLLGLRSGQTQSDGHPTAAMSTPAPSAPNTSAPASALGTGAPAHTCDELDQCCTAMGNDRDAYEQAVCSAVVRFRAAHSDQGCDAALAQLAVREAMARRWPAACPPPDPLAMQGQRCAQVAACCDGMRPLAGNRTIDGLLQGCTAIVSTHAEDVCANFRTTLRTAAVSGGPWPALPEVCGR